MTTEVLACTCVHIVIASEAKQSRLLPRRDSGLLRCAEAGAFAVVDLVRSVTRFSHMRSVRMTLHLRPRLAEGAAAGRTAPSIQGSERGQREIDHRGADQLDEDARPQAGRRDAAPAGGVGEHINLPKLDARTRVLSEDEIKIFWQASTMRI
ncbi:MULTISPECIES: hypothetical protein [unclassified Bradyrhizobium]|uniref:hypothetical protein n=1 Tax=unclassified Bradyrhizobium TaxID=2631580 RepID=UPI00247905F9|nr:MULTISPECIES: hypothetical protein [unclassified Bradyrhizobium]WGR73978.1 hypothetical protein MTX24_14660 [Bradyrhizobium sp. ISRA426]WGR78815.1 hypothetical protein MTX21_39630 [Bradyrhizobium sp. ISRA430]WGR89217.1 hypothetical protein MTX25_14675 [Bradyrhizobium sp. ISRA432]